MKYALLHKRPESSDLSLLEDNIKSIEHLITSTQNSEAPQKSTGTGMNFINGLLDTFKKNTNFDMKNIPKSLESVLGGDISKKLSKGMEIFQRNVGENPSDIGTFAQGFAQTINDPEMKATFGDVLEKANGLIGSLSQKSTLGESGFGDAGDQE